MCEGPAPVQMRSMLAHAARPLVHVDVYFLLRSWVNTHTTTTSSPQKFQGAITVPVNLPPELLHKILLDAAQTSPSSRRVLCEVSSWVRRLTLPISYRTVSINHTVPFSKFAQVVVSGPLACPQSSKFHPADVLRHLWVSCPAETLESVVRHCDNVTHLAIHRGDLTLLANATIPNSGERTHAGTNDLHIVLLENSMHEDFVLYDEVDGMGNSLFERIIHLRFANPIRLHLGMVLFLMPHLTHFTMPCGDLGVEDRDSVLEIVAHTSIEAFVLVLMHEHLDKMERRAIEDWICESRKDEEGIYAVTPLYSKLEMEWDAEVRGGATIWEAAVGHTQRLMSSGMKS